MSSRRVTIITCDNCGIEEVVPLSDRTEARIALVREGWTADTHAGPATVDYCRVCSQPATGKAT